MYGKNEIFIPYKQRNIDEMLDEFKNKKDVSILNSTAFTETFELFKNENKIRNSFKYSEYLKSKNKTLTEKAKDYGKTFNPSRSIRMEKKENAMNKNVNILNYKFGDNMTYILNSLPKFKRICKYNKKAEKFYTEGVINERDSDFDYCNKSGKANKISVQKKCLDYIKYINTPYEK